MSYQQDDVERFYQDRVAARRQLHQQSLFTTKVNHAVTVVTVLVVAAAIASHFNNRFDLFPRAASAVWRVLIFLIPANILFAVDSWKSPVESQGRHSAATHETKTAAIRRILGLDGTTGVMASMLQARARALSATSGAFSKRFDTDAPPGLGNMDNSCYQNSILQGLSALEEFPQYLDKCLEICKNGGQDMSVAQTLRTLISDLNSLSNRGRTLWTPRVLKSMSSWTQQDAQEYFSKVLDDIDKAVSKSVQESKATTGLHETNHSALDNAKPEEKQELDPKRLRNPLEGLLAQRVACVSCGYSEGISLINFNCLTLSLGLDKNEHDIYERLDAYTKMESIEGVECPKCTLLKAQRLLTQLLQRMRENNTPEEKLTEPVRRLEAVELALEEDDFSETTLRDECKITAQSKVSSTKTKQIVIGRPPKNLVVHMNRSVFDPSTFNMMKNSAPVKFPKLLDLGPWCLGSSGVVRDSPTSALSVTKEQIEHWQMDAAAPMAASDFTPSRITGPMYELRAAVTHYGRHENGHYICYRRGLKKADEQACDAPQETQEEFEDCPEPEKEATTSESDEPTNIRDMAEDDAGANTAGDESPSTPESGDEANKDNSDEDHEEDKGDQWWRLSDETVSEVSEQAMDMLAPGVFMLFYECVEPDMAFGGDESGNTTSPASAAEKQRITVANRSDEDECGLTERSSVTSDDDDATLTTVDTATDDGTVTTVTSLDDDELDEEQMKAGNEIKIPLTV